MLPRFDRKDCFAAGVVAVLTFLFFSPSLQNGFVWDDIANFLNNRSYRGLDWSHLRWILFNHYLGPYQPLAWLSSGIDYALWGMNPIGYHLGNLLLHSVNAALLYFVTKRILATDRGGWNVRAALVCASAALLFSLHPLRVEPVVWATERRTLLAGMFFLVAVLSYLNALAGGASELGAAQKMRVGAFYALALLSKGISIGLPITLLALDAYPLRRLRWDADRWTGERGRRLIREKLPFFALAGAFGAIEIGTYTASVGFVSLERLPLTWRFWQPFLSSSLYLSKTLLPIRLSPLYELPVGPAAWQWPAIPALVLIVALTALVWLWRRSRPWAAALWIHFLASLLPVFGVLQVSSSLGADRYTYIACMGWSILAAGAARGRSAAVAALLILAGVSGVLSWRQSFVWRDEESLWKHALSLNENASVARTNLGDVYLLRRDADRAIALYLETLAVNPGSVQASIDLGGAYFLKGDIESSEKYFRSALTLDPSAPGAHNGLGLVLANEGRTQEAISQFLMAAKLDPEAAIVRFNLGEAYRALGQDQSAAEQYEAALALNPELSAARIALERIKPSGFPL